MVVVFFNHNMVQMAVCSDCAGVIFFFQKKKGKIQQMKYGSRINLRHFSPTVYVMLLSAMMEEVFRKSAKQFSKWELNALMDWLCGVSIYSQVPRCPSQNQCQQMNPNINAFNWCYKVHHKNGEPNHKLRSGLANCENLRSVCFSENCEAKF